MFEPDSVFWVVCDYTDARDLQMRIVAKKKEREANEETKRVYKQQAFTDIVTFRFGVLFLLCERTKSFLSSVVRL